MSVDPARRMLELLSVLQSGRSHPAAELAARLGTAPRTLRRDIDRLRDLGYPVESERGPGGGYRLVAGTALPPLLLTDDEAVAVVLGLRLLTSAQPADAEAAEGALGKLEQVLPSRLRARVGAMAAATEALPRRAAAPGLETLRELGSAAYGHRHVRFAYTARNGRRGERRVEPYRLVLLAGRWYLLGWDRDRGDWRTFRADRIDGLEVPGTTFTPREPPAEYAVSFVQDPARFPVTARTGVVRFAAPIEVVSERLSAEAGALEAIDAHSCRYVTATEDWPWLAGRLAATGLPYTVEGPPELIAATGLT